MIFSKSSISTRESGIRIKSINVPMKSNGQNSRVIIHDMKINAFDVPIAGTIIKCPRRITGNVPLIDFLT